jgi:peptide/nickel transport system permease protein
MRRVDPWFAIGLFAFFALLFVALFGERIAPYEPIYFVVDHGDQQRPYAPGEVFPLGSDVLGRDLFSLVLAGARATLIIGVVAGLARVLAGLTIAVAATWWRPLRLTADSLAEIVSAVPATLVAVLIVLIFIRDDTQIFTFVGALLVTGWAGPYRVARTEIDRLRGSLFTESALTLGVGRLSLFVRHHLPHLVPILSVSTAQQSVASLVAVAELGVLGIFVGATKFVNVSESVGLIRITDVGALWISEIPEWGGLLANGRGIQNLWTTRWVILVPGVAFALAAVAMSVVGLGIARQYQRRNAFYDVGSRGAAAVAVLCAVAVLASVLVPERYAEAREWADSARARATDDMPLEQAFAEGGLRPVGASYAVERQVTQIQQTAPGSVSVAGAGEVTEEADGPADLVPVLYFASGGAVLDAPIVFAGWGLSPTDHPTTAASVGTAGVVPSFGTVIKDWADDHSAVDVRGKVAVVLKMPNIQISSRSAVPGQDFEAAVRNALKRGAVAVLYVDPALPRYQPTQFNVGALNPYQRLAQTLPIERPDGPPVFVLSLRAAERLLGPFGSSPNAIWDAIPTNASIAFQRGEKLVQSDDPISKRSLARDLGARAHVELPIARVTAKPRSLVGTTPGEPSRVLIWAIMPATRGSSRPASDALGAMVRSLAGRTGAGLAVVAFDRTADPKGNARAIAEVLGRTQWDLIVVLDDLDGDRLRFQTIYGDLIPMFDEYAKRSGARAAITRSISNPETTSWLGMEAFPKSRSTVVRASGEGGDMRGDVAALLGYIAGRDALGAPELRR